MFELLARFSFDRKITSYSKVQKLISSLIRNKKIFISSQKTEAAEYLNIGSSSNTFPGYVNLDYAWHPHLEVCWDITKLPLPFEDGSFKGIFTEHCLEHIPYIFFKQNLKEFYRILKPGGTLRIVMPDAEIYIDWYVKRRKGENLPCPYGATMQTSMMNVNNIFRSYGHQFLYDFETGEMLLKEAGFTNIVKEKYQGGRDKNLLIDQERRQYESLYLEATKP